MKTKKTLAINLLYNPSGGSLEQIKKILENLEEYKFDSYIIYTIPSNLNLINDSFSNKVRTRSFKFAQYNLITRTIFEQLFLPFYLFIDDVTILFCPGNIAPIFSLTKKAQWIGTIGPFEKEFVKIYSQYSLWKRFVLFFNKVLMLSSAKTSDHVFFESFYTRDMFVRKYNFHKQKASVLQIGRDDYFKPEKIIKNKEYSSLLAKKYILSVSHLYPYKNIETLIHSFKEISLNHKSLNLVLAGSTQNQEYLDNLNKLVDDYNLQDNVFFLGNLDRFQLRQFYSNCYALIFTSPFENFAYTLVEAMSCGAPIISTNTTAMPETCSDAAIYFEPYSVDDLSQKVNLVLVKQNLREKLSNKSMKRSNELETYKTINIKTNTILQSLL